MFSRTKPLKLCALKIWRYTVYESIPANDNSTNLLDEVDARLEIEAKVNELPFDALLAVLLLLQHEHVVVEELLQPLVGQVDAQLLERVHLSESTFRRVNFEWLISL